MSGVFARRNESARARKASHRRVIQVEVPHRFDVGGQDRDRSIRFARAMARLGNHLQSTVDVARSCVRTQDLPITPLRHNERLCKRGNQAAANLAASHSVIAQGQRDMATCISQHKRQTRRFTSAS